MATQPPARLLARWEVDLATGAVTWLTDVSHLLDLPASGAGFDVAGLIALCHPEDRERVREAIRKSRRDRRDFVIELRAHGRSGRYAWLDLQGGYRFDADGVARQFFGSIVNIDERKATEARLVHDVTHDSLTGLANRAGLHEGLTRARVRAIRAGRAVAVAFVDLDDFKAINDRLGHAAGDEVLRTVARRLGEAAREGDIVARLGGDEFVIVFVDLPTFDGLVRRISQLLEAIASPIEVAGERERTTASIGVDYAHDDVTPERAIERADVAMYRAKSAGRNTFHFFDEREQARVAQLFSLETELRVAVERDQFTVHYQPIVRATDRRIVAFEALLRWSHPSLGSIAPDGFLAVAESSGLLGELGTLTRDLATRDVRRLGRDGNSPGVALNVTEREFYRDDFATESPA